MLRPDPLAGASESRSRLVSTAELYWLPVDPNWNAALPSIGDTPDSSTWAKLVGLANARLDLVPTIRLDRHLQRIFGATPPPGLTTRPVRLAVLGSSTVDHLHAGIRVAGLRRGLWVTTWQGDYGQYAQALSDPNSSLRQWAPTDVLFALDARHLLRGFPITEAADQAEQRLVQADVDLLSSPPGRSVPLVQGGQDRHRGEGGSH